MIAALLHLHEGTGSAGEPGDQMRRSFARGHNVGHGAGGIRHPALWPQLVGVAQHTRHAGQTGPRGGIDLRGAAGDNDRYAGSLTGSTANCLARLPLGLRRDRTGVDDHGVGQRSGVVANHLAFVGVQAAAEGEDFGAHAG
jgi:hypothetical protein